MKNNNVQSHLPYGQQRFSLLTLPQQSAYVAEVPLYDYNLERYAQKVNIDTAAEIAKDNARTYNNMQEARFKADVARKRDQDRLELQEEHRDRRELKTMGLVINSDDCFCMESIPSDADEKSPRKLSKPICDMKNVTAVRYYAHDSPIDGDVLWIRWLGKEEGIYLSGISFSPKGLKKGLSQAGVVFRIPRRKFEDVIKMLFSFLNKIAQPVELPRYTGWTKDSVGNWRFEADKEKTLEGVRRKNGMQ